jgi:hypothetical protein
MPWMRVLRACCALLRAAVSSPNRRSGHTAQLGARWTLWVRRTDSDGVQYSAVRDVDPSCSVDELKALWASDKKARVDPERVALRLVKRGSGKPDAMEEAEALRPERLIDDPRLTLVEAGFADGCALLAEIAVIQHSSGSPGVRLRPAGLLAAPMHVSTHVMGPDVRLCRFGPL